MELYEKVRQEINRKIKVGCTACGYCMPCPKGIDIPGTFRCYNELYTGSRKAGKKEYLMTTAFRKKQNPRLVVLSVENVSSTVRSRFLSGRN